MPGRLLTAYRHVDITHAVNKPLVRGECRVFGPAFSAQLTYLAGVKVGKVLQNAPNAVLVGE
jgi:hypothetical protein